MGGGNKSPTSSETSQTEDDEWSSRATSATERTEADVEEYAGDGDGEGGADTDNRFPNFESFMDGKSVPSADDEDEDDGDDILDNDWDTPETPLSESDVVGAASGGGGGGGGAAGIPEADPAESFDVQLPAGIDDADGAGQFGRTLFSEGAVAARHLGDGDNRGLVRARNPGDDATGRFGGWPEFDEDNVTLWEDLGDADADEGVTADYMEMAALRGTDADSYRAYITHYDNDGGTWAPQMWQAHSQMATYAFTDAVGVRVPDHTWDSGEEYVAAAGVEKPGRREAESVDDISSYAAKQVDRQEFIDVAATQVLSGNRDLHSENIKVADDGQVHCIDYDRGGNSYDSMAELEAGCMKASRTAKEINSERADDFDVSKRDIADRAQEIAVSLEVSGEKERVLDTVEQYDDVFGDTTGRSYRSRIGGNIEMAADAARK